MAEEQIDRALFAAGRSSARLARLSGKRIAGRVLHAQGRRGPSGAHFERALELAAGVGSPITRSQVVYEYAQTLEAQGDAGRALGRYREAYQARLAIASHRQARE